LRIRNISAIVTALLFWSIAPFPALSQVTETQELSYPDLVDLVGRAPIVAVATIDKAQRLKGELAGNVSPGQERFLITGSLNALLRGDQGLPARIEYLVDLPAQAAIRASKLRKTKVLLAASKVPGKPASLRLFGPAAQLPWTPGLESRARKILLDSVSPNAPPRIVGVGNAFHVNGTLPGESETQIFLKTANDSPVSLNVLRRPGEETRWAVALGEMVDDSARPPARETLLWYQLACFLPPALPDTSVANLNEEDALAANNDYRFVIQALGDCDRSKRS
jgi:hypothetical protein